MHFNTVDIVGIVMLRRVAAELNSEGVKLPVPVAHATLTPAQWIGRSKRADLLNSFKVAGVPESAILVRANALRDADAREGKAEGKPDAPDAPEALDESPVGVLARALDEVLAQSGRATVDRADVVAIVREEMAKGPARTLVEIVKDGERKEMAGLQHHEMPRLLRYMARRKNVFLVGPPGTGKSTAAALAADALLDHLPEGARWSAMSVTLQSMVTDFMGYRQPTGTLVRTGFRDRFEHGGVFILDEVDKGSPNVLGAIQTALSNGFCAFPDGIVKMHPDFCVVATGNTYGNGRTAAFVGSNALDAAFLNRFARILWPIDLALEEALTLAQGGESAACWLSYCRRVRAAFEATTLKVIVSPRQCINGAEMLAHGNSWEETVQDYISNGLNDEAMAVLAKVQR